MKVYLSGPVSLGGTLTPEGVAANHARFRVVRQRMAVEGHEVLDPTLIAGEPGWMWRDWMRAALSQLLVADRVHLLPGWELSPGARVEAHVAHLLDIPVTVDQEDPE